MNIEIQKPDLAERVIATIRSGRYQNTDELLEKALDALASREAPATGQPKDTDRRTGADLIAALQASPHRELDIEPPRILEAMPARDVTF